MCGRRTGDGIVAQPLHEILVERPHEAGVTRQSESEERPLTDRERHAEVLVGGEVVQDHRGVTGESVGISLQERVETSRVLADNQRKNTGQGVWRWHMLKLSEAGPHPLFPNLFPNRSRAL